jgi:hypothetical protein
VKKWEGRDKRESEQECFLISSYDCSQARPKYFSTKLPEARLLAPPRACVNQGLANYRGPFVRFAGSQTRHDSREPPIPSQFGLIQVSGRRSEAAGRFGPNGK